MQALLLGGRAPPRPDGGGKPARAGLAAVLGDIAAGGAPLAGSRYQSLDDELAGDQRAADAGADADAGAEDAHGDETEGLLRPGSVADSIGSRGGAGGSGRTSAAAVAAREGLARLMPRSSASRGASPSPAALAAQAPLSSAPIGAAAVAARGGLLSCLLPPRDPSAPPRPSLGAWLRKAAAPRTVAPTSAAAAAARRATAGARAAAGAAGANPATGRRPALLFQRRDRYALHGAAWRGDMAELMRLLAAAAATPQARADVDRGDKGGLRPLALAAWRGHTGAMQALIEAGADVNGADTVRGTASGRAGAACGVQLALLDGHCVFIPFS